MLVKDRTAEGSKGSEGRQEDEMKMKGERVGGREVRGGEEAEGNVVLSRRRKMRRDMSEVRRKR